MRAADGGHTDIVKTLVKYKANVNDKNNEGKVGINSRRVEEGETCMFMIINISFLNLTACFIF